ncbi:HD-GYP domain-containing protein [Halarsenatibacter silvermanii]|uniref:HDIG domain-containing protein n=1 Tax=Halarsenatibacter silvermanii TaxID=321763 RepID=A0A1G9N3K3_9FIRM|nr:HD-GYP domain-containing protein [Halarsenatibacter silvermanii]SDL81080.1 HDIG domain-containing protein [Halarsenatibacter silvermanii]
MAAKGSNKKIDIDKLKPGMTIAEDIGSEFGAVLIPSGTVLTEEVINRLEDRGRSEVEIFTEAEEERKSNLEKVKEKERDYRKSVIKFAEKFEKFMYKRRVEYDDVLELTEKTSKLSEEMDLVDVLTAIRRVDEYTYTHSLNVGILAGMFAEWINLSSERKNNLVQAGIFHDIGKAKIPESILKKPDALTKKEFEFMKQHSVFGFRMVKESQQIEDEVAAGILTHHERYDGSGYPRQYEGEKIPLFGRVLAIVDAFDAMTADRVYQRARPLFYAIKVVEEESFGHFDYKLKEVFLRKIPNYLVDERVKLNNKKEARIIFIPPSHPYHPIIKVDDLYLDLKKNPGLEIVEIIKE